jgi:SAM-dependent methyltransferase
MSVFGKYAAYYDLIYRDKDYVGEATYIHHLIQKYHPATKTILDLGCGTGRHAKLLAQKGYLVHGVDLSQEMLNEANKETDSNCLVFSQGDVRTVKLGKIFDVVVSLFHVVSYQTTNDDLRNTINTAFGHLENHGFFIFDCWYGPTVLSDRPTVRIKRLESELIKVTRIAEPVMYANENLVDVNYDVFIRDKAEGLVEELHETHRMRYLFKPELELLLNQAGFEMKDCFEFMTNQELSYQTWNGCFIARKITQK